MHRFTHVWAAVGLGALLVLAQGCHVSFDVKADGAAQIQGSGIFGQLTGLPGISNFASFDISQQQDFKNQGVSKDHLQSVKLKSLILSISDPKDAQFDFLDSIAFYAQVAGNDSTKVKIAHKDSVPHNANSISLDLDDAELVELVTAPQMSITTTASGRSPANNTTIQVNAVFDVVAKL